MKQDQMTSGAGPQEQTTCLLVDDHPLMRTAVRLLLEADAQVTVVAEAGSGEDALRALRELRPDVAVMDATLMTGLDGLHTTQQASEERLPTRVVVDSGHDGGEDVRRALDSGAYGYVCKSSPREHLVNSLHAAASGKRYVDPHLISELLDPSTPALSARERDVLELIARGMPNDRIADDLGLAIETVKTHVSHLLAKLGVQSRAGAVAEALRSGMIT